MEVTHGTRENSPEYNDLLGQVHDLIRQAQNRALRAVNKEGLLLNYRIGSEINRRRDAAGPEHADRYGKQIVKQLAQDLTRDGLRGYGQSNLEKMALFASSYTVEEIADSRIRNLGWTAHRHLMEVVKDKPTRLWYMEHMLAHGWTVKLLKMHTSSQLHLRVGADPSQGNLEMTLPPHQAVAASQLLKRGYDFSFLSLDEKASEYEVEAGLVTQVARMIHEFGNGFAFLKQQYAFTEGDQDFRIDLLFYHVKLHAYVVIELKIEAFTPEMAGKLNFYVSSIDDLERTEGDNPTIGILLCPDFNPVIVERSVRGQTKPMHVSGYARNQDEIVKLLPKQLQAGLPKEMVEEAKREGEEDA